MNKNHVKIIEVGPRDGLQNERNVVSSATKIELINRLSETGLSNIEVSSFVNPKKVPQLADAQAVFSGIRRVKGICYSALVPNEKGFSHAVMSSPDSISVFTAASNTFCENNINCGIDESIERFVPVLAMAKEESLPVRAYVSCVLGCPYEGYISPANVSRMVKRLWEMGCEEISLGDTIGAGTPRQVRQLINACQSVAPIDKLAVHYHDTRGQALANILASLELGIRIIDSSVAGLGGCPYAPGATGNVATEDLVYLLNGMGYQTGVDLNKLIDVGVFISQQLSRENNSKVGAAGLPKRYKSYAMSS